MADYDNAPQWLYSSGEALSMETTDTPAPFVGYMPFRNGPDGGGYNLLFSSQSARVSRAVVLKDDSNFTRVWLEFEGITDLPCLECQPIEIYGPLIESGRCTIVSRVDGIDAADEIYGIPVRIEILKASEAMSASEVSNGARSSNVSCQNGDGRRSGHQQSNAEAVAALLR